MMQENKMGDNTVSCSDMAWKYHGTPSICHPSEIDPRVKAICNDFGISGDTVMRHHKMRYILLHVLHHMNPWENCTFIAGGKGAGFPTHEKLEKPRPSALFWLLDFPSGSLHFQVLMVAAFQSQANLNQSQLSHANSTIISQLTHTTHPFVWFGNRQAKWCHEGTRRLRRGFAGPA